MKFEELKNGQIIWDSLKEANNSVYIVLEKGEKAVKVAFYVESRGEIINGTVFRDEWLQRGYESLTTKKTWITDSKHARKIIKEILEFGEFIFNWDK